MSEMWGWVIRAEETGGHAELQTGIDQLQRYGSLALRVQVTVTPATAGTGSLAPEKSPPFQEDAVQKGVCVFHLILQVFLFTYKSCLE